MSEILQNIDIMKYVSDTKTIMSLNDGKSIFCFVLFFLCIKSSNAQNNCITFYQNGVSVVNSQTKLVCKALDSSHNFIMTWDFNGQNIYFTEIERKHGRVTVRNPCPEQYDCEWNQTQSTLVVTINKTTFGEDGHWACNYYGESGCTDKLELVVNVTGMIFKILLTCL